LRTEQDQLVDQGLESIFDGRPRTSAIGTHDHAEWRQLRQCVDIRLTACSFDIGQAEVDTEWDRESQPEVADSVRVCTVSDVSFAGVDMRASLSAFAGLTRSDRRIASPVVGDPFVIDISDGTAVRR
jgi:hypothetical protein